MYISNGIAYAGEQEPIIKVCGVRPLPGLGSGSDLQLAKQKFLILHPC